jgi:hypothetical protein
MKSVCQIAAYDWLRTVSLGVLNVSKCRQLAVANDPCWQR